MGICREQQTNKRKKPFKIKGFILFLADTQGFEPWIQVLPGCTLSRGVPSTTRPRVQACYNEARII